MTVREAEVADLGAVLGLYAQLHDTPELTPSERLSAVWQRIVADVDHHVILVERERVIAAVCSLVVVPNLTHNLRPYGFIENVVTDYAFRRKGCATLALDYARELAERENCYKLMLMTSRQDEETFAFYEKAGYNRQDKTAFVQWL